MSQQDQLHRFLFPEHDVRGELIQVSDSLKQILATKDYPLEVQNVLAELVCAASLLTATLKFKGEVSLQLQGEGALKYAVINGTDEQCFRGIAKWEGNVSGLAFQDLFEKGILVITIKPDSGEQYQGMVAIDQPTLSGCIERYFEQSEQLPTKVKFFTDIQDEQPKAGGIFLQVIPTTSASTMQLEEEGLSHLWHLAQTISQDEFFNLEVETLLYRLYHQEKVTMLQSLPVQFKCSCSKGRSANALKSVDKAELHKIIEERGCIEMHCQYCHTQYTFDSIDVEAIHAGAEVSETKQ